MATYYGTDLIRQIDALQVPDGMLAVWGLGQMGVALKSRGSEVLYIDPILSNIVADRFDPGRMQRAFPPPVEPDLITNASYVLASHEHVDHADPETLKSIAKASPNAKFVASRWSDGQLDEANIASDRRIVPPDSGSIQLGDAKVTPVVSAHYEVEHDPAKGYRWHGFLIEWNGVTFYHGGDTLIYPGYVDRLKELGRIDIAMLAINGRDAYREAANLVGNLMPIEAAWLCQQLEWDVLIGGHNDLYEFNSIERGATPNALHKLTPRQKYHVLQPGELYLYVK